MKVKVALYARCSTDDKGQDTENQLVQLREFCQRSSWTIVHEYVDNQSGRTAKRGRFQAMFAAARKREFDLLLFWSLDRLSREGALETLQHLQALTEAGVGWKSYTEQYLDSTGVFRDAVISILATVARQETIRQSERVRAGMDRAKRAGRSLGRPALVVDRSRIVAARKAGESLSAIAEKFGISKTSASRLCE